MEKTNEKKDFLQKTWVVCALALVCTFLWGSASPCIKLGYALFKIPSSETWTQVLFAGTRFVFAGVLTILIGSILNRKMLLPTKSSVPSIVKLAMFQTILQYIFFYIGLAHNSGVKASIINGSNTFFRNTCIDNYIQTGKAESEEDYRLCDWFCRCYRSQHEWTENRHELKHYG